eukprot:11178947-Lingulodinium_polyedra.AAC.1
MRARPPPAAAQWRAASSATVPPATTARRAPAASVARPPDRKSRMGAQRLMVSVMWAVSARRPATSR